MTNDVNPLLDSSHLPRFDTITAQHISPAIKQLLDQAQQTIHHISNNTEASSWDNVMVALENATESLEFAWGVVNHLNAVVDTPAMRAAYAENLPHISAFFSGLTQNQALYQRIKNLAQDNAIFNSLNPVRKKVLENALRDFRLGGAELDDVGKARLALIKEQQAELSKDFDNHVLDATDTYSYLITHSDELSGLPDSAIAAAYEAAQQNSQEGWRFTLQYPSYISIIKHADDRTLRKKLFYAYVTRASELGPRFADGRAEWDNTSNMVQQLSLRHEEAALLGFKNYAELSLTHKMANSSEQVQHFLNDLASRARPYAQRDWATLCAFSKEHLNLTHLEPWDITYAAEKLRQAQYDFSEEELRPYFPAPQVIQGLFYVATHLFGIHIKTDIAPTWHTDVAFYRIEDKTGKLLAHCYMDLYARNGKHDGAWMNGLRNRKRLVNGQIQTPIACITCNFPRPLGDQPALLSHDEVITLFHEFGHSLHHMLTKIDEPSVAGIHGVEWDAVELPSQMLENFCWSWEVIQRISAHVETGSALPHAVYQRMLAAKNFQKGIATLRQIVFSTFDMHIHSDKLAEQPMGATSTTAATGLALLNLAKHCHNTISVTPTIEDTRWPHSFSHIFSGGYAAGYYSYKWAEVLSADAYAAFEEAATECGSILNSKVGAHYCREILETGGSRPAMTSFRAFRYREPSIEALLRHDGIMEEPAPENI